MESNFNQKSFQELESSESINIREELEKYVQYWRWFLVSVLIVLTLAFLYLRYTTPQYNASTSILIKDNQKSGISDELKAVADLGIVGTGSANNTDNEIEIIKSRKIIGKVVDSLHLNISIYKEGRVKTSEVYKNIPFKIDFFNSEEIIHKKDTIFILELNNNSFTLFGEESTQKEYQYNEKVSSSIGFFKIQKNELSFNEFVGNKFKISIKSRDKVIDSYRNKINVSPVNKNSSVLNLNLTDPLITKAEDILNELVKQ